MKIRVLFFSILRDLTGVDSLEISLDGTTATVEDVVRLLVERFSGLEAWEDRILLAVDCEYADLRTPVREGCEVALFPPVQGG